jgi:Ca2+-binding EF-hand superfamily protein
LEFSAKDRDNNEKISLAELELLFEGLDKNYDVNKIMTVADTNGDNVIDFREFVRMNLDKDK